MTMKYLIPAICLSWVVATTGNGNGQGDDYYGDDYFYAGSNNNQYGQNNYFQNSQNNGYGYNGNNGGNSGYTSQNYNGGQNNAQEANDYDYYGHGDEYYDNTMYGLYGQNGGNIDGDIYGSYNQNQDMGENGGAWINGYYHPFCTDEQAMYNVDGSRKYNPQKYWQTHANFQKYYGSLYGSEGNNGGNYQNAYNNASNNADNNNAYNNNNNQNEYVVVQYNPNAYDDDNPNAYGDDYYAYYMKYHEFDYWDGQYVERSQYQDEYNNINNGEYYGEGDGEDCIDYRTYTPAENCRQSVITVKSVEILCDSPYQWTYKHGGHRNSETCSYGDKARITVFFENAYDLPDQKIYWTIGVYARKQELELLWTAINVDLCSEMVGHQCTQKGNYAFSFLATLQYSYSSDSAAFAPVVEMGFSTKTDEGYDLGGVNIDCKFTRGYQPYDASSYAWAQRPVVWGAGAELSGLYGFLIGLSILCLALILFICKQKKGKSLGNSRRCRWPWRRKRPLLEDEMYISPSGSIAEV